MSDSLRSARSVVKWNKFRRLVDCTTSARSLRLRPEKTRRRIILPATWAPNNKRKPNSRRSTSEKGRNHKISKRNIYLKKCTVLCVVPPVQPFGYFFVGSFRPLRVMAVIEFEIGAVGSQGKGGTEIGSIEMMGDTTHLIDADLLVETKLSSLAIFVFLSFRAGIVCFVVGPRKKAETTAELSYMVSDWKVIRFCFPCVFLRLKRVPS